MVFNLINMRKENTLLAILLLIMLNNSLLSQCKPKIKIDNTEVIADMDEVYGLHLPYWLKTGQTLAIGSNVSKISVIEFTVDGTTQSLNFSQVLNINSTSPQTVPANKVWKIESIAKIYTPSNYTSITYSSPGTYTFIAPSCAENICIEIWGAGGGGGQPACDPVCNNCNPTCIMRSGGGGGGAFGTQCYSVSPNQTLTIVVGQGGGQSSGGSNSSVSGGSISITANGGNGGGNSIWGIVNGEDIIALGGISNATSNSPGGNSNGVRGGSGGNGGVGGGANTNGIYPGDGGGGASVNGPGGTGANGKVVIKW
jgi:hypothetical protein